MADSPAAHAPRSWGLFNPAAIASLIVDSLSPNARVAQCDAAPEETQESGTSGGTQPSSKQNSPVPTGLSLLSHVARPPTAAKPLPNPGPFENYRILAKVLLEPNYFGAFDGFQFTAAKMLSPTFQISHSFNVGTCMIPKDHWAGMYALNAQVVYDQGKTAIVSSVNSQAIVQGRLIRQWNKNLMTKLQIQTAFQDNASLCIGEVDWTHSDHAVSAKLGQRFGYFFGKASYMQSMSQSIAVGCDLDFHSVRGVVSTFVCGKKTDKYSMFAEYATKGQVALNYMQPVSPRLAMGAGLAYDTKGQRTSAEFGYKYNLKQSEIKGHFDTNGRIMIAVKEVFPPIAKVFLSAEYDVYRGESKFGWGMEFGQG